MHSNRLTIERKLAAALIALAVSFTVLLGTVNPALGEARLASAGERHTPYRA